MRERRGQTGGQGGFLAQLLELLAFVEVCGDVFDQTVDFEEFEVANPLQVIP